VRARSILFALIVALPVCAAPYTPPNYTIQELPGIPNAISNSGWVAGTVTDTQGRPHGYRWRLGKTEMLPERLGHWSAALAVNDPGIVAGWAALLYEQGPMGYVNGGTILPARFQPPSLQVFGSLGTFDGARFQGINNRGDLVGWSDIGNGVGMAPAVWTGTFPTRLPGVGELLQGAAQAVNAGGLIVGWLRAADWLDPPHAVLWQNSKPLLLSEGSGRTSQAFAISSGGMIAGWVSEGNAYPVNERRAAVWRSPSAQPFIFPVGLSMAMGINSAGVAVGFQSGGQAALFASESIWDLKSLLVNGTGWLLGEALGINDAGWIVGDGWFQGRPAGFLLTPVPTRYVPPSGGR
jgi:uncharacterized membrane protein